MKFHDFPMNDSGPEDITCDSTDLAVGWGYDNISPVRTEIRGAVPITTPNGFTFTLDTAHSGGKVYVICLDVTP